MSRELIDLPPFLRSAWWDRLFLGSIWLFQTVIGVSECLVIHAFSWKGLQFGAGLSELTISLTFYAFLSENRPDCHGQWGPGLLREAIGDPRARIRPVHMRLLPVEQSCFWSVSSSQYYHWN